MQSVLTKRQRRKLGPKVYTENGETYRIIANVRHDDECGNGHNTFSITGEIDEKNPGNGRWREYSGGCIHDKIAEHFPELAPFIKWHLMSADGPLHYVANTMYLAGDRDCYGKRKGEAMHHKTVISFGDNPITINNVPERFVEWLMNCKPYDFEVIGIDHGGSEGDRRMFGTKYTFGGYAEKWHECPFDTEQDALNFLSALKHHHPKWQTIATAWGEGKEPELEAARRYAIWPDATVEQLTDEAALADRLPALLADFQRDVESLGLVYDD
jgi:hypothetical protein